MTQSTSAAEPDLSGVQARIGRARTHLDDFDRHAGPLIAACRNAVTRERRQGRSEHIFRIARVPATPPVMNAILGDAIHNLRVSLDYLAWQLVIASGNTPDRSTALPIHKSSPEPEPDGTVVVNVRPGIDRAIGELLNKVQPYQLPKPAHHELAMLHALDNSDKHRQLLTTVVGTPGVALGWWGAAKLLSFHPGPYDDSAEICRFSCPDDQPDFQPDINFAIALREPEAGPWRVMHGASDFVRNFFLRYVENEVLPLFGRFFPATDTRPGVVRQP